MVGKKKFKKRDTKDINLMTDARLCSLGPDCLLCYQH